MPIAENMSTDTPRELVPEAAKGIRAWNANEMGMSEICQMCCSDRLLFLAVVAALILKEWAE